MWRLGLLVLAGCGRISFDPLGDAAISPDAFAGPSGSGVAFDGVGYATADSVCAELTGNFTIEAWFKSGVTQVDPDSTALFAINDQGGGNLSLVMWDQPNANVSYYDDVFTNRNYTGLVAVPDSWHFISFTSETSGYGAVYYDGMRSVDFQTSRIITAPCLFSLGQEWDGVNNPTDQVVGVIDEVSVWNVAKTPAEIVADKNANVVAPQPTLVAYYPFDGTTDDASGHGHTMTLVGAALVSVP